MTERPIPYSAPMVLARREGRKTQTRRIVKPQFAADALPAEMSAVTAEGWQTSGHSGLWWCDAGGCADDAIRCPHGVPGDHLWVREAYRFTVDLNCHSPKRVAELCMDAGYAKPWAPIQYEADGMRDNWVHTSTAQHEGQPIPGKYRPPMFMPRWAARGLDLVKGVRIERLQDISEADAIAEGIEADVQLGDAAPLWRNYSTGGTTVCPVYSYQTLWELINGPDSWAANPWVWVITFKVIKP